MEEVWKDITFSSSSSSLHCPHGHNSTKMAFQDFLARPFSSKDTLPQPQKAPAIFSSQVQQPPPATALSLNSCHSHQFHFLDNTRLNLDTQAVSTMPSLTTPFESLASPSAFPAFMRKRLSSESDSSSGDRRHKRMIKNRESAARSRARKQAYTSQLEREVSQLAEENARLKKQQEQLLYAAAHLPSKQKLHRTLTAPF